MPRQPSKIPPEIARHRKPGTQVKCIRGKYYLQRVTSRWDKDAKKIRKVVLEHIGMVTPEGVVPKRTRRVPADAKTYSKEFGATWAVSELTRDIHEALRKHFPEDADWLYVTALLRCIRHCAMRYTEHLYGVSYLSERFPGLNLSSLNLSNLMTGLGFRRVQMVAFMREFIPEKDAYMLFDGTAMVCNSRNIYEAQRGYNSHGCHDPQINLMYAAAICQARLMPVFYKRYPGSVRDVSAFENMRAEMGAKNFVAVNDKGFVKAKDQAKLEEAGIHYIAPLRRNSAEYERTPLEKPGLTGFQGRFMYNGRIVWHYEQPAENGARHRYVLYLDETLRHLEQSTVRDTDDIGNESPDKVSKIARRQLLCGTICLKTSLMDMDAKTVYSTYKIREEVEQLFDTYKAEEDFNTTGMHSSETQEACLFLNHLSIMMAYRVYNVLRKNGALKKYAAVKTPETYLWDVRVTNAGDGWQLEPIPKTSRKALEALGLAPPETLQPPQTLPRPMA
ncbi:MAG: transposase [Bacteroidales bacterium]|nr:transposase [Bacteroidales bacterium]